MPTKLRTTLDQSKVDAWFWGHEHDCLAYRPHRGVTAAAAIGHGAVPTLARTTPAAQAGGRPPQQVIPVIAEDTADDDPLRAVKWEYRDSRLGEAQQHWAKHGWSAGVRPIPGSTFGTGGIAWDAGRRPQRSSWWHGSSTTRRSTTTGE